MNHFPPITRVRTKFLDCTTHCGRYSGSYILTYYGDLRSAYLTVEECVELNTDIKAWQPLLTGLYTGS